MIGLGEIDDGKHDSHCHPRRRVRTGALAERRHM